ncbi:hypothetical protein THRCLA_04763 [Thraustotheca clavata]|uniref:Uncharacterized protein n=1 Tax=Thraustotheca clavata TaxID=74557 RepID=A0A1V9ZY07_9STRA|nr:hypothetical protein THRCLA_04763 [Thraustotheca clavata]
MDRDEMLDDMSLSSDDEMFEDMINEMQAPAPVVRAPVVPVRAAPVRSQVAAPMPDLSKMMAQMMPMMSQMFGNAGPQPQRISRAMEDIIADYLPPNEASEWVQTIKQDQIKQRTAQSLKPVTNLSRSYCLKESKLPSDHLKAATLMQELLIEAVRNAKVSPSATWEKNQLRIHTELQEQGVDAIYARELRASLARHVRNDPDVDERFPTIQSTLLV